jgi:putative transcriptional regulator
MNLGERVKQIRQRFNLSQADLAKKLGVGQPYISSLEKGKEKPSDTLVFLFCHLFFIRKEWLLKGEYPVVNKPGDIAAELRSRLDCRTLTEVVGHLADKPCPTSDIDEEAKQDSNLHW